MEMLPKVSKKVNSLLRSLRETFPKHCKKINTRRKLQKKMAMVTRSARLKDIGGPPTAASVGPGSYVNLDPNFRPKHSLAPFNSSVERACGETAVELKLRAPGPGHYDTDVSVLRRQEHPTSQFTSKVGRLQTIKEIQKREAGAPGPGSYDIGKSMITGRAALAHSEKSETNNVKWVKIATAPSIPGHGQSYGYDEGPEGQLVMQPNPKPGHTGKGRDHAGPGEYDPSTKIVKPSAPAPDFGRRKERWTPGKGSSTATGPGPGTYSLDLVKSEEKALAEKAQGTANFLSRTERTGGGPKIKLMGPELYAPPSSFLSNEEYSVQHPTLQKHHVFGATTRTTSYAPPHAVPAQPDHPGPGQYDAPVRVKAVMAQRPHGVFGSTGRRLAEIAVDLGPGPGNYSNEVNTLKSKVTKTTHHYGAFGSTKQRFSKDMVSALGPGAYNPPVEHNPAELRRRDRTQAPFRSHSQRLAQPKQGNGPAPGTYEPAPLAWGNAASSFSTNQRGYFSTSTRKLCATENRAPGPGSYDAALSLARPRILGGLVPSGNGHVGPVSTGRHANSQVVPGPGAYNTTKGFVKKTFNITVGETWD